MDRSRTGSTYNREDTNSSDDKRIKQDNDSSAYMSEDFKLRKSLHVSKFITENIRFSPEVIQFVNAYEGKQFSEKFTIQNIGKNPVYVKIGDPFSFMFQLKRPSQRLKLLSSGCSFTKTITYTYHSEDLISKSQLPVLINGNYFTLPIVVKIAKPEIEINPQKLNFEVINLGTPAKSMMLTIVNTGSKRTKFEIDCGKNSDLVVSPMRGTLKPRHPMTLRVEIMQFKEGEFYRELWIKTTEVPIRVPVLVEVVVPRLEISYPIGTGNFTLIHFQPTFKGTQRMQYYILKNRSVECSMFVTLAEIDGELQVLKKARKMSESLNMFVVTTEDGLLGPFENRLCNVLFRPKAKKIKKGWHHIEKTKKPQKNHVVFLRINQVHAIGLKEIATAGRLRGHNPLEKSEGKSSSTITNEMEEGATFDFKAPETDRSEDTLQEEKTLRLCIHGEAIDPDILIQPSSLDFGDLVVGQTEDRVIKVTNKSVISVKCKLLKKLNVKTTPQEVWLKSEKAHEFLIRLTPTFPGNFKTKMEIQLLGESDVFYSTDKPLVVVGTYSVFLSYTSRSTTSHPSPKVVLGITPFITDDVGFHKELITYKDAYKYPYAAMLGLKKGFKPNWMKKEEDKVKNVENALIALPNDRPRFFHSWPKDKVCRTIFKGFFRYSPPEDLAYTLSPEGMIEKKERRAVWANFILERLKQESNPILKELDCLDTMFFNDVTEKLMSQIDSQAKTTKREGPNENVPKFTFVPLTPMFLYRINVLPTLVNFSKVAVDTVKQETIRIQNTNTFPISIKFSSRDSKVWMSDNDTKIIPPQAISYIHVFFQTKDNGHYFGFLNYIINGSHEFKIPLSALVLPKTLILHVKVLSFGDESPLGIFQPRSRFLYMENVIHCPVKFSVSFSEDSAFSAEITEGEVPPKSRIFLEILMTMAADKCLYSDVTLISESGKSETAKLRYQLNFFPVHFLSNPINMGEIPLNLPTTVYPMIYNASYQEVFFEVLTLNPIPGVSVEPAKGLLKGRSFKELKVVVKIPVIMSFSFKVEVNAGVCKKLHCNITGNVVFPKIDIRPSSFTMRKICEHSFDRITVDIMNEGKTPAEIELDFSDCPEFTVEGPSIMKISGKQTEQVVLRFNPKGICHYGFYLPIIINGILGPPFMQHSETEFASFFISHLESDYVHFGQVLQTTNSMLKIPCASIYCSVVKAPLRVLPSKINFRTKNNLEFQSYTIKIVNVSDEEVVFCVRDDDIGKIHDSPFDLVIENSSVEYRKKAVKAQLGPNENLILKATFSPKKPGSYEIEVPVFIKRPKEEILYDYIHLKGKLEAPHIQPTSSEVYFAPLPLGVGCDVTVTIWAENYKTPETIYFKIWDPKEGTLGCNELFISWLEKPIISKCPTENTFRLKIVFRSSVPIALRKYIILFDSMGTYATILVTAVADNSAVTTHAFLSTQPSKYEVIRMCSLLKQNSENILERKTSENSQKSVDKVKKKDNEVDESSGTKQRSGYEIIEKEPMLVVKLNKSMSNLTDLGVVNVINIPCKGSKPPAVTKEVEALNQNDSESNISSQSLNKVIKNENDIPEGITYPKFPDSDEAHWNYFRTTLNYVERWMFEMVMKCDQYFSIPMSFQRLMYPKEKQKVEEKDFLCFLEEFVAEKDILPKRPSFSDKVNQKDRVNSLRAFFCGILTFLQKNGCLIPHIRPEYLMQFDDYMAYIKLSKGIDVFTWGVSETSKNNCTRNSKSHAPPQSNRNDKDTKTLPMWSNTDKDSWKISFYGSASEIDDVSLKMEDNQDTVTAAASQESASNVPSRRQLEHKFVVFDKDAFELRSTQAWLDIVIQIFRVFVMGRMTKRNDPLHPSSVYGPSEAKIEKTLQLLSNHNKKPKIEESLLSNVYTVQEQLLLDWLNQHSELSRKVNNFTSDLSDSVALISLTSFYCPYIVETYFKDVFDNPDTPSKKHHNASRLVQAWRTLQLGFTIDTQDIMRPNLVFMLMLLTHLYQVLPSTLPNSTLRFRAPLNSESTKVVQLKNHTQCTLFYEVKFFGEQERFFSLQNSESSLEIESSGNGEVSVKFLAKQIKKITATLFLCGNIVSPNFGRHIVFNLEGEPSELTEYEKFSFTVPLYKMICSEIQIKSPYSEPMTYNIWYTTRKPECNGEPDSYFKPWSSLWNKKVSRRLFLDSKELKIAEGNDAVLRLAVASLTVNKRRFWLLFRSEIGDFIIMIEIIPKVKLVPTNILSYFPKGFGTLQCTCLQKTSPKLNNFSCPCLMTLEIPMRNDDLWKAMRRMFFKTLQKEENPFWEEYFEKDIGICLILWLLDSDEEEEVVDEFVKVLSTKVNYTVDVEPSNYIVLPKTIEIPDVRNNSEIDVPIHVSTDAPSVLNFVLTLTSENEKEVRTLQVQMRKNESENSEREVSLFDKWRSKFICKKC